MKVANDMDPGSQPIEHLLGQLIRKQGGCAFAATADGHIVEATAEGWRLIERWWRLGGRAHMREWLGRSTGRGAKVPLLIHLGTRQYRLSATILPMRDAATGLASFCIRGEELIAGGSFTVSYVRRAYGLTAAEADLLNLYLLGRSPRQSASELKLPAGQAQALTHSLHRKLSRRQDCLVQFKVTAPQFAKGV